MGVLQRFERRLEGLVNGAFAKAFKSEVQPVEIAGALQRECDERAAIVSRGRTMVPNDFVVELGAHDHERLATYAAPLAAELAQLVTEYGQEQRYMFVGPVEVRFERIEELSTGMFRIRSQALAGVVPMPGYEQQPQQPQPAAAGGYPPPPAYQQAPPSIGAWLEINGVRQPLTKPVVTIGRGTDVDLRVDDPSVSRRHIEIRQGNPAVVSDLGSTNGILVDQRQTTQAQLHNGSVIQLGNTTIIYRREG